MLKRICKGSFVVALLALVLAITSVTPVLAYEDKYASNGDIDWRWAEDYRQGIYTLNGGINGTTSTLTMFLVTQNVHFIDQWSILYSFPGKMNREDPVDFGFEVDVRMPANYTPLSTMEIGGTSANIIQVQVGIYPGYYNFYNYGYNDVNRANSSPFKAITLGPNYQLFEEDEYKNYDTAPEDTFIEIQEGENKRVYVLVGELDFLIAAQEEFENWAIEAEAHYVEESTENGFQEEIDVDVPEENLENLLESAKPEVDVETESTELEASVFEGEKDTSTEKGGFNTAGIVILVVFSACGLIAGFLIIKLRKARG